jgi:GTP-binding protein
VHLVESFPGDSADPAQNYRAIRRELELFNPELAAKPELVVLTKMDLSESEQRIEQFRNAIGRPVLGISAVTGRGLAELVHMMYDLVRQASSEAQSR